MFIDEVLAVGDMHFRKKCVNIMEQLRREGRTFVIVSQTAEHVRHLCDRAIWLHEGEIRFDGTLEDSWNQYRAFRQERKRAGVFNEGSEL